MSQTVMESRKFDPQPRSYDLHIGVGPDNLMGDRIPANLSGTGVTAFVDGDGWTEWGEAPGTLKNDDSRHVIIRSTDVEVLKDLAPKLSARAMNDGSGTIAVISDSEDWGNQGFWWRLVGNSN